MTNGLEAIEGTAGLDIHDAGGVAMSRKRSFFAVASVFLAFCGSPAFPQSAPLPKAAAKEEALPSVDELAAKCAKASGGKEAWAKLSTQVLNGTIELPAFGLTGKVEFIAKAPNKMLHVVTLGDGQFVQKQGFDGRVAWKSDTQTGLRKLEGAELEQARMEAIFDSDVRLKEVFPDMKVTGRAKVGDRDTYTVLAHEPGGKTDTFYFDTQTGQRIAVDSEGPDESGKVVKANIFLEDFRAIDGIQMPFRIRIESPAASLVITLQEVHHNVPIEDSIFAMPSGEPSAAATH
jgi:hypothetical protein